MITQIRPHALRRSLVLCVIALSALPALIRVGQAGVAHAASSVTAGFFNNSSYPIVQLTVDNHQIVPGQAASIPPQGTLTLGLSAGAHTYIAANGLAGGFTMYTFNGSMAVRPPVLGPTRLAPCIKPFLIQPLLKKVQTNCAIFNDPSITALLTRFGGNGTWNATFFDDNGAPHINTFTFRTNGSYVFSVDGRQLGSNSFMEVNRNPAEQTITFNVGGSLNGIFSETQGVFFMENDPHGNALEYS
jgi:hypothetical protein